MLIQLLILVLMFSMKTSCDKDPQTAIMENGKSQMGQFSFEVFRFVKRKNPKVSVVFLHCVTKLCKADNCPFLVPEAETKEMFLVEAHLSPQDKAHPDGPPFQLNSIIAALISGIVDLGITSIFFFVCS